MLAQLLRGSWSSLALVMLIPSALVACGSGDSDAARKAAMNNAGAGAADGGTPQDAGDPNPDASVIVPADGGTPQVDGGHMLAQLCEGAGCGVGQRCELDSAGAVSCVDNTCEELACDGTMMCASDPAGGHVCANAMCEGDVDCLAAYHCDSGVCVEDVCTAGVRSCSGGVVLECSNNGDANSTRFTCASPAYFTSACVTAGASSANCTCEDDWDCPSYTTCDVSGCVGTGAAPTCSLPPIAFTDTPPSVEFHWGSDSRADAIAGIAHDGTAARNTPPWAQFNQVANTPMVANLDDDNGDGLINELDFPEIVFVTHQGDNPWSNGVLRAIHGGGPNKGADYFARCGGKLWTESAHIGDTCAAGDPDADSGAPVAIGDIDNDGVPEIVYTLENSGSSSSAPTLFRVLDNTGAERYTLTVPFSLGSHGAAPSIVNIDSAGYAEIVYGRNVYVLAAGTGTQLIVTHILTGGDAKGINPLNTENLGPMACVADIIAASPGQEIVAGATLYKMPASLPTCGSPPCTGTLDVVWNAPDVPGNTGVGAEGFCAVADLWGADAMNPPGPTNRPDGKPEVILIDDGHINVLDGATGALIATRDLGGQTGGAPNVDDFDGDGFLEVASALQDYYIVVDFQQSTGASGSCPDWPTVIPRDPGATNTNPARTPGAGSCTHDSDCDPAAVCNTTIHACVCLHNGWMRDSDDDSSRATSSSVFDFNGDGASEVIYNDECDFRVYNGLTGAELFSEVSRSRTLLENPVVADVDNDGNAEIVAISNTYTTNRCDDDIANNGGVPIGPNGVRVWGDPTDTWVAARRIWNQQSYHITNVAEGGRVPTREPESWRSWNGRLYNTYRSQPRSFGIAPDLTVVDIGISSPDAQCGSLSNNIDIAFEVKNKGDLRVGPGVPVRFFGTWAGTEEPLLDDHSHILEVLLQTSIEPGTSVILSVHFAQGNNGKASLPDSVRVVVDPTNNGPNGVERECDEANNSLMAMVTQGDVRADLKIDVGAAVAICPNASVDVVVHNVGTATARHVVVRYYAGDPAQGGTVLTEQELSDPIDPGGTATFTQQIPDLPGGRNITIYAVVDPDRKIAECNEANNKDDADNPVGCTFAPQ